MLCGFQFLLFPHLSTSSLLVLRLRGNKLRTFSPRAPSHTAAPCFSLLADLDLSDNKLTEVPASLFTACPNLTHVSFARNEIRELPSEKRQGTSSKTRWSQPSRRWYSHNDLACASNFSRCLAQPIEETACFYGRRRALTDPLGCFQKQY